MAIGYGESIKPNKPWYQRAWRNLRKRWVQVVIVLVAGSLVAGLSWAILAPRLDHKKDKEAGKFKFLHCDLCNSELAYNPDLDGKKCSKCSTPPKVGWYVATEKSIKSGFGAPSPYRWAYLSIVFDGFICLAVIVYLLYRPYIDPGSVYYVFYCPYCSQRLRFRHVSLNGIGQCTRCKRMIRFPDEDTAIREDDLIREEQERLMAEEEE